MVMMCSIPLCKSVASKKHNVKLHKFPASEELRRIWIDRIMAYYPNFKISKFSLVCSKHFAEIDFFKTTRSTSFSLCKDAVPSLFDVDECVYVFNDGELDGDSDITSLSIVDVMETSIGVTTPITVDGKEVTPSKMNDSFDIVEVTPSKMNVSFDIVEVTPIYSFGKDAVSPLLDGDSDITRPSIVDVMETSIGVTTPTKMSNNSNISEPSNADVMETSILDIQVPVTPKRMTNTSNKPMERKWVFGDFKADDLNTPRKRKRYWDISQQTVSKYKCKTKLLQNKNTWLTKKVKNLCQLIDHLKEENKISESCFSHLKVCIKNEINKKSNKLTGLNSNSD
ncbi:unnamed protein product [Macrosiphum euphorbiae]|uniref:THAP-type domain-containing protein n=1 Tax=Macrosiphum euphorbiae TaxID=13131 RepID=A0AAV0WL01_9HEMI|nr:unnamed protein product [Macrosiphum euphorbiae]